ncbi:MAG TPA: DEAD/DEAH box helicase [Firmicutes bacterium]|jgi:SNF2 family DNA or RNA helicase|nr:DEAD/DEAH box helicase [Bacillota bacterium]
MDIKHDPGNLDVLRRFLAHDFDTKEQFALRTEAEQLSLLRGFDRLLSLDAINIELYEHQQEAVMRVLRDMRGKAILADEVGLGKTIEAGVVLKEYLLRGLVRRVLILVPASLVGQWRQELHEKLALDFTIGRRPTAFTGERVIASLDSAKRADNAAVIHDAAWDMVIVDEAHRLKNKSTLNWAFVNAIEHKFLLLLTATPIQNDLRELYNLITLLKPGQLKTYSQFKLDFMADRHSARNLPRLRELLADVMIRRSRHETLIRFPKRHVQSLSVELTMPEQAFYQQMVRVLRRAYLAQPVEKRNMLPLILLLRETCSHPRTAQRTLRLMAASSRQTLLSRQDITSLTDLGELERPAKLDLALDILAHQKEKVLLFTEFRTTQDALMAACRQLNIAAVAYHGGMSGKEKDAAIERFRRQAQVLISTEAGGEGRNLQFCRTLVNYDLPWNPMRIEQRIGRIHRLGQVDEVHVINIVAAGTIEAYILYLLEKKIRMFSKVIGELDAILTNLSSPYERTLAHIALTSLDEEQVRARIEAFGKELEAACATYEQMRNLNAQIFAADQEIMGLEA